MRDKLGKKLRLGVLLPSRGLVMTGEGPRNLDPILSMAEVVEQAGLDSVWLGDSLTAKPRPGTSDDPGCYRDADI